MSSFDERFIALHRVAFRAAFTLVGDRAESQDLAQEALTRALVRWRRVEPYAEAWVCRVATNLAIDRIRRDRRIRLAPEEGARVDPDVAERLDLQRALLLLSRRQRDVVVLRYLHDHAELTVAEALGISVGSVKTHASRGLAALRTSMGQEVGA